MKWNSEETIVAIATPVGVGGIGIIRLSGRDSLALAARFFRPAGGESLAQAGSHRLLYGWIHQGSLPIDEVMAVYMKAPRSYTREDVVELHCHGGPLVLRTVLDMLCRAGARLAEPGEFTRRAFLNGRIDLTRVEATADIVRARSLAGLRASADQLRGGLYEAIGELREKMARMAALVEAELDFPEEEIVPLRREEIAGGLRDCRAGLARLVETAERGRRLRDGLAVAIVGRPNVGKSSLLNAMLRESRAIVTDLPGTTRDTVEEAVELGGILLNLIDTAGIRESVEEVEREGVARSRQAMERADLVLLVLDGSRPLSRDDEALLAQTPREATLVIVNKRDLMGAPGPEWEAGLAGLPHVTISALTREGLEEMEKLISNWALGDERPAVEEAILTNYRQKQAVLEALERVGGAQEALEQGLGAELLAVDLQLVLEALGRIVGETTPDELLERIFSEFCIGK